MTTKEMVWREVSIQRPYEIETLWDILTHIAALTSRGAVVWEARCKNGKMRYLLGTPKWSVSRVQEAFRAHASVQFTEGVHREPVTEARKIKVSKPVLSLNTEVSAAMIRAALAAMTGAKSDTECVLQVILGAAFAPSPTPKNLPDPNATWLDAVLGNVHDASMEQRKAIREKSEQYTYDVVIRVGITGDQTNTRLHNIISAFRTLEAAGVHIRTDKEQPTNLDNATLPWRMPLKLSVKELACFLLLPAGEEELPGTPGLHPKLLLPPKWYKPSIYPSEQRIFAASLENTARPLSIAPKDALEHTILLGPTGSGKSTAMQSLILADIRAGRSVLVLDPKADLVTDLLERIPEERKDDVVVIDPSDPSPVGFNPLAYNQDPSLTADAILAVFQELFSANWGIRSADVLGGALLTLARIPGSNLLWLPQLLTDEKFRQKIVSQIKDPIALEPFWRHYDAMRDSERRTEIAPVLNKLRQITYRPGLRNVLGQSEPKFSLNDLFLKRRIVLVPLNRGLVGAESARLLGSLIVGLTWTLALSRANVAPDKRHMVSVYGLLHFDAWAANFGETVTAIELAPEGSGYRAKTRFARFYNLPELISMFKQVADIQTADMLNLPVPKANYHNIVLKPSEQQKEMVAALSERAEKVRNREVDSSVDNMLLITNDGRKLALDQRLMNPLLGDSETSKVGASADIIYDIWQRTTETASAQMVFCDLSTPHNDGKFNVYDDLRDKLIAKGVPAEQIAYIHSANTEAQKKEMFGKVRSGQIRVLLGSTQKMGAGTNVQQRLIALHHLDCPWRPSDLQQRDGRIVRQGNMNDEVDIYIYVAENTFDSYLYQLLESKQRFIGQIMTSKSPVRSAEDIDETALSYAEIKALCTGNPYIKEKMDLDIDVQRLRLLKSAHLSQRYSLEDQIIKEFPQQIRSYEQMIVGLEADIEKAAEHTHPNEEGFSTMVVENIAHDNKKAAGSAILEVCANMTSPDPIPLGRYRGFAMKLHFDSFAKDYIITLQGELSYPVTLGTDIFGNIQRLDNVITSLSDRLKNCQTLLANVQAQMETAKVELEKPFPQEDELKTKSARLDELNILLNLDKKENEIIDGDLADDVPDKPPADRGAR